MVQGIHQLIQNGAQNCPDRVIYRFHEAVGNSDEFHPFSYAEFDSWCRTLALSLTEHTTTGDRAILLYEPGPDYTIAFFGCLYAGLIPVPAYPPRANGRLDRVLTIIGDVSATVALTSANLGGRIRILEKGQHDLNCKLLSLDRNTLIRDGFYAQSGSFSPATGPQSPDLAFLQYTSGSTSRPKGVMVSHSNLLANMEGITERSFPANREGSIASWLPPYHDMGLIAGILLAPYLGTESILMSPMSFLKRPALWLETISRFGAHFSGGPNFAYELCSAKVTDEEVQRLTLNSWRCAFNAAEAVRIETMRRFFRKFASAGLTLNSLAPAYGLAEATLLVSGNPLDTTPGSAVLLESPTTPGAKIRPVSENKERPEELMEIASCGPGVIHQDLRIVHPVTMDILDDGMLGEVWLKSDSVAGGYWNRKEESEQTFNARTSSGESGFLRTGDLGFLWKGELYITGRIKEVIIQNGRNHYPQDIENTLQGNFSFLRTDGGAAFSEDSPEGERLIVVHEVERTSRNMDFNDALLAMQEAVARSHDIIIHEIALILPGALPRTSSGKIQRLAARGMLRNNEFKVVARFVNAPGNAQDQVSENDSPNLFSDDLSQEQVRPSHDSNREPSESEDLVKTIRGLLARELNREPHAVSLDLSFQQQGVDSVAGIGLLGALEQELGLKLESTLIYDYPNIRALAAALSQRSGQHSKEAHLDAPNARETLPDIFITHAPGTSSAFANAVAIVGMACRFPGAQNLQEFEILLESGKDAIREADSERLELCGDGLGGHRAGWLSNIDCFDADFFSISPREAMAMDPQQRMLLELAYETLENANQPSENLHGEAVGVFIGIATNEYLRLLLESPIDRNQFLATGNALSVAANRISYAFGFCGPSMAIDTACSSSLSAVMQAVRSIQSGDCETALAGGANLILTPEISACFESAGLLSANSLCRSFDASSDGIVRSEGLGLLYLKSLDRAMADGDRIYSVIKGGAINQDGASNGLMAPSGRAQQAVIQAACKNAGVEPGSIQYAECHGTGTPLGDPIEARALGETYGQAHTRESLRIGSVKSNIGHCEAAAGVAGLIKLSLMIHRQKFYPTAHFNRPNPGIDLEGWKLQVQSETEAWQSSTGVLRGSVSSFGFGGTNVHLIVDSPPDKPAGKPSTTESANQSGTAGAAREALITQASGGSTAAEAATNPTGSEGSKPSAVETTGQKSELERKGPPYLLVLSARSRLSLKNRAKDLADYVDAKSTLSLGELCYAITGKRDIHDYRKSLVFQNRQDLIRQLEQLIKAEDLSSTSLADYSSSLTSEKGIVLVYPGQGRLEQGMGRSLYDSESVFRATVDKIRPVYMKLTGADILHSIQGQSENAQYRMDVMQGGLFALQAGLTELWRSMGLRPAAAVGHSLGEITAAWASGALDLESALKIVALRSGIQQKEGGAGLMAAVAIKVQELHSIQRSMDMPDVEIAAVNGPESLVIAGYEKRVNELLGELEKRNIKFRRLETAAFAGHCAYAEGAATWMKQRTADIHFTSPELALYSTVLAKRITNLESENEFHHESGDPGQESLGSESSYWARNIREPVRFYETIQKLIDDGYAHFLEIGPYSALSPSIQLCLNEEGASGLATCSLRKDMDDRTSMYIAAGDLIAVGADLSPEHFVDNGATSNNPSSEALTDLPSYPWDRKRFWIPAGPAQEKRVQILSHSAKDGRNGYSGNNGSLETPQVSRATAPRLAKISGSDVRDFLLTHTSQALMRDPASLNEKKPLEQMGFDSLMSVQLRLALEQRFDIELNRSIEGEDTIEQLIALVLSVGNAKEAEALPNPSMKETRSSEVPLVPSQHWFFEHNLVNPHHWNSSVISDISRTNPETMQAAIRAVVRNEEIFNLRFEKKSEDYICHLLNQPLEFIPLILDCKGHNREHCLAEIQTHCDSLQRSLDIYNGPLVAGAIFVCDDETLLFLTVHHLIFDGVSWIYLLNRIDSRYKTLVAETQGPKQRELNPGLLDSHPENSSRNTFVRWARKLQSYASSETAARDVGYWSRLTGADNQALPRDLAEGPRTQDSLSTILRALSSQDTTELLTGPSEGSISSLLLACLIHSLNQSFGITSLLLETQSTGRNEHGPETTIPGVESAPGWFSSIYPFHLRIESGETLEDTIRRITGELSDVPRSGNDYGVLRYLRKEPELQSIVPGMKFLYHGNLYDSPGYQDMVLKSVPPEYDALMGAGFAEKNEPRYSLYLYSFIRNRALNLVFSYCSNQFRAATVEKLASQFMERVHTRLKLPS